MERLNLNKRILAMTKKHFVGLAEVIRQQRPRNDKSPMEDIDYAAYGKWEQMRDALASFCQSQNAQFNRERFLAACGVGK
jgi:hypothetical protein